MKTKAMKPLKLLVADDHEEFRKCLVHYMRSRRGIRVVGEARDGVDAIREAKRTRPDLVLMNTKLARVDGWSVAKTIKSFCPSTHLIAISLDSVTAEVPIRHEIVMEAILEKGRIVRDLSKVIAMVRAAIRRERTNRAVVTQLRSRNC